MSDHDRDLERMTTAELAAEVKKLRQGIRRHRDATGHNVCWYVPELWELLPEKVNLLPLVPPREEFLQCCAEYRDSIIQSAEVGDLIRHAKLDHLEPGVITRLEDARGVRLVWVDGKGPYTLRDFDLVERRTPLPGVMKHETRYRPKSR